MKDDEKNIYELPKAKERKARDLNCLKRIKDEEKKMFVKEVRLRRDGRIILIDFLNRNSSNWLSKKHKFRTKKVFWFTIKRNLE